MKQSRLIQAAVTAVLILVYAASRFWGLTASCLWFDEIFSVNAAEHTWSTIFSFVARDLIHPPLFYLLLKIWIAVGGEGLLWLRLLPVVISIFAIIPFLYLCRELRLNDWSRYVAFLLIAVNGSLIKYSQELRMYSLLMCLSMFSMWMFVRYFHKGKSLTGLIIVNVVLVYAHYFGWLVVLSEVFAIIIFQRIKMRAVLLMLGIAALAFLPWAIAVVSAAGGGSSLGQNIGWMQPPGELQILQLAAGLTEPFYFQASNVEPFTMALISVPLLLIIGAALVTGVISGRTQTAEKFETKRLLAILIILPLVVAFVVSWASPYSVWGTRHLIIVFAPVALLIGSVVGRIEVPAFRPAFAATLLILCGGAFALRFGQESPMYSWCAWDPLAADISAKPEAPVYVFEDLVAYHFWFTFHESGSTTRVSKVSDVEGVAEDKSYFLPRGFDDVATVALADANQRRLWIAYRGPGIDENAPPLRNFLSNGYHISDRKIYAASQENAIIILLEK